MATYKQIETAAITMTVAPLVLYLGAGLLRLQNAQLEHLFVAAKLVAGFSCAVGIGAWLVSRPSDH